MTVNRASEGLPPLRPEIAALPAYVPGARPGAGERLWKLSSNENPYPPLPAVLRAIGAAAGQANRYPDMYATPVAEAVAGFVGVPASQVVVGNGSVAVLAHILAAFVRPGDEVIFAWRSFEAYPISVEVAGGRQARVPLRADGTHDLPAMAAAITESTRVVIVCTPNNPTGASVGVGELRALLAAVPSDVLVVIDEAYLEFVRLDGLQAIGEQAADEHGERPGGELAAAKQVMGECSAGEPLDALALLREYPNVVVLRTLSKAYGLASLRVGYALAAESLAEGIRAVSTPFGVSGVAQEAAIASLAPEAQAQLFERVDALVSERERVVAALHAQGWRLPATQANFVWFGFGDATAARAEQARNAGILVRPFVGEGLRVSIGEPEANDALIALAARWAESGTNLI